MLLSHFLSFYKGQPNEQSARECYLAVEHALWEEKILTPLTLIGALATARTEIGKDYKPKREIITPELANKNYGARYGNRRGTDDGFTYRGAGIIQLTFRGNYQEFGDKIGVNLVDNPDLLMDINISAKVLARYFKDKGVNVALDKKDFLEARILVNGINPHTKLPNGYSEYMSVVNQFLAVSHL